MERDDMSRKKTREVPLIISQKTSHMKDDADVNVWIFGQDSIRMVINNHEVHQYLRHRSSGFSNNRYDPLSTYKKSLEKRIKNIIKLDDELSEFIEKNKHRPVKTTLRVSRIPSKTASLKTNALRLAGVIKRIEVPDVDNFTKTIFDACNTIMWNDDAQVYEHTVIKDYDTQDSTLLVIEYDNKYSDEELKGRLTKEDNEKYSSEIEMAKKIKSGELASEYGNQTK